MFDLLGPGTLITPWAGVWDLAWQSPTTGLALLACLPTLLLTGFFLVTRDGHRQQVDPFIPSTRASDADQRQGDQSRAAA